MRTKLDAASLNVESFVIANPEVPAPMGGGPGFNMKPDPTDGGSCPGPCLYSLDVCYTTTDIQPCL